jgi:tetraacyldisaccharide 4'-kinase
MNAARVLSGEDRSMRAALLRALLLPLAGLHAVGLEVYLLPFRLGLRRRTRLGVPVISIGNLTSGGTGKTPMTVRVAQLLRAQGVRVAVLSRGHGGRHEREAGAQVVSDGTQILLDVEVAGDEPVLLAHLLPGVPVIVGRDRRVSGRLALARFAPEVLLLDDGLQFWQLERDLDIVLVDSRRPFDNGFLLPRGLLREPPWHLRRAGAVVVTRADRIDDAARDALCRRLTRLAPDARIFTAAHDPVGWVRPGSDTIEPLERLVGAETIAFSGIADGMAFAETLRACGLIVKSHVNFGDHHAYNKQDVISIRRRLDAGALCVTTEKDLTKVASIWPESVAPPVALRIALRIKDEPELETILRHVIHGGKETPSEATDRRPARERE